MDKNAKTKAILLIVVVVPSLMVGLGLAGFILAKHVGLEAESIWIALILSTAGFAISIVLTLRVGKAFETKRKIANRARHCCVQLQRMPAFSHRIMAFFKSQVNWLAIALHAGSAV